MNWIHKKGYSKKILATEDQLSMPGTMIQLAKIGKGEQIHYHKKKTESYYFLKGYGKAVIDGVEKEIKPGTFLQVKPDTRYKIVQESPEMLEVIMFKTNNDPEDTHTD